MSAKTGSLKDAAKKLNILVDAQALLAVAQVLDGRPNEEQCAIMAAVSATLGFYDEAQQFLNLARAYRQFELERLTSEPDGGSR